jgi:ribosomal protein L16 Arg81 hydroxylase
MSIPDEVKTERMLRRLNRWRQDAARMADPLKKLLPTLRVWHRMVQTADDDGSVRDSYNAYLALTIELCGHCPLPFAR